MLESVRPPKTANDEAGLIGVLCFQCSSQIETDLLDIDLAELIIGFETQRS